MSLPFGHHYARLIPTARLIIQVMQVHDGLGWWPTHRTLDQMVDLAMEYGVGGQPDGISKALGFMQLVQLGIVNPPSPRKYLPMSR